MNDYKPKVLTSTGTCAKFGWSFPSGSGEDNENGKTFWSGNPRACQVGCPN